MHEQTKKNSLNAGDRVGRYEIREVLGIGGFGITYKAWDTQLNRLIALKEYLPAETAVREHNASTVQAHESRAEEYHYGLERFLDEAKTLAKFHHPNIIGVYDYLQANNTAYLIMTYEQGQTLSQQLQQHGGKLPELELKAIVKAILTGLQHIHEQDYYHRDIKPGNIYLRKQGEPVLIDFGAARQAIGARSRSLTNIVSAGYAPSEQYGSNQSKQGPWSDLYAVGATMYRSISGQEPADAPTRSSDIMEGDPDPLIPAIKMGQGRYTEELLQLIDWMLAPAIKNRPQNVNQVLSRLEQNSASDGPRSTAPTELNEEVRSTVAPRLVTEADYQRPKQQVPSTLSEHDNAEQKIENAPAKSRRGIVLTGLGIMILAVIGYSQKQTLQEMIAEPSPSQTVIPSSSSQQQTAEREQQRQNRVTQGLAKKEQQRQLQQQKEEQARQERLAQQQEQQTIQTLLKQAGTDIQQMRLSRPQGNNAVEKYQQILQLEADNQAAQQGLTRIAEKYLAMAATAQQQKHYQKARQLLKKAKIIQPENNKITLAERQLNTAETNYQQEQAKLAERERKQREEQARLSKYNIVHLKYC